MFTISGLVTHGLRERLNTTKEAKSQFNKRFMAKMSSINVNLVHYVNK